MLDRTRLTVVILVSLAAYAGCSSSSSNNDKKLSDLTTEEATALCKEHAGDFDAIAHSTCKFVALVAQDKATCEQLIESCTAIQADAGSTSSVDCAGTNATDLKGCTLTVGEMASCLDQMATFFDGITCAEQGTSPTPPKCSSTLAEKCPSLFGDTTPTN